MLKTYALLDVVGVKDALKAGKGAALLFTRPEFRLDVFYGLVRSLKHKLEERVGQVYCIVNRDDEVEHPSMPALGGTLMGSDMKPAYFNVAGSGAAWVNLHLADRAIGRRKDWHDKYSLYAVGANSIPPGDAVREEQKFKTIDGGDAVVAALA